MSFFALKISDPGSVDLVNKIKAGSDNFVVQQLNQLENELKVGEKVFIQLGGDKVSWDKGLIGLAQIIRSPFDKGYDSKNERNFKLGLKMVLVLESVIKREEFRFYIDAYDAGGIGPNTKGEQNQAIKSLTDKQAYAILRAMVEHQNTLEGKIKELFDQETCNQIFGKMACMIEKKMTYNEVLQYRKKLQTLDEFEETNKQQFREWLSNQRKPKGTVGAGELYESIDPYVSTLSSIKINIDGVEHSIFATTNMSVVTSLEEVDTKAETNKTAHNRKSSAIKLYIRYLEDNNYGEEQTKMSEYIPIRYNTDIDIKVERNRIVFGAPGTGKSFQLKDDCEKLMKNRSGSYERVTFHPDYSYSQFVGTYKPVMDMNGKDIRYDFVPGPFIRILVDALKSGRTNSPQPHLLIIEEINRAKVAAVFGDVFQLLDRDDDGVSVYEIHASEDIRRYLSRPDVLGGTPNNYEIIKIPNNMFIWATMNSADQGVFPMDTAFKRRWNFEYLGIDKNEDKIAGKGKVHLAGLDEPIEWNVLRKAINAKMSSNDFKINEDKLMGPFFLSKKAIESDENGMIIDKDKFINTFKSKVIMYLYEDAVKQGKHRFFDGCDSSKYSSVCEAFDKIGLGIFGSTFKETFYDNQRDDT